jgi:glycosyltransferase involved in cell wall biosynthesis
VCGVTSKLYIHAANVHQGGGSSLLTALLVACPRDTHVVALIDRRMILPDHIPENLTIKLVKPSIWQRLCAELWLALNVQLDDSILCFGNLPPLFRLRGHVVVFVQNRYLVDDVEVSGFPLGVRLRLIIERLWLSMRTWSVDEFVVQTPTMKRLLEKKTGGRMPVNIVPFVKKLNGYSRKASLSEYPVKIDYDFVYVASGEPHKNHRRLLEAWCLLAKEGIFYSLCLTLDVARFAGLGREIEAMHKSYGLLLTNVGELSHEDVLVLYKRAGAAVFPSTFESFGLPLIEARQAGLPILAPELDYVRDVLDPEQSFDPESPVSIARAVKRFMGVGEQELPLLDAAHFFVAVLGKVG